MRSVMTVALIVSLAAPIAVQAQQAPGAAPAQAAPKFTTRTKVGQLLADPQAKAVLEKHVPLVIANGNAMADLTLWDFHNEAPNMVPEELLKQVDADLAKIK